MLIKISTQAVWNQGINLKAYFSTITPLSKVLYLRQSSLICWRRRGLAFAGSITFLTFFSLSFPLFLILKAETLSQT